MSYQKNGNNNKKISIDDNVQEFARLNIKKFKKQSEDYYESKKELKYDYYLHLIGLLPDAITFVLRYGYVRNDKIQSTKNEIFKKLTEEDFVKVLRKELKSGEKIENIKLLPILYREILAEAEKENQVLLAEDPNAKIYKLDDIVELSQLILKKPLKKMEKSGVDEAVAFDALSVIPTDKVFKVVKYSQNYRIRVLFEVLYDHAKTKPLVFKNIIKNLVDEDYYPMIAAFALLERKEKFGNLTDSQKSFYIDITNWMLGTMEALPTKQIEEILRTYVNARGRDARANRDGNRRYLLSTLSERDYPKITKVVRVYGERYPDAKKYL